MRSKAEILAAVLVALIVPAAPAREPLQKDAVTRYDPALFGPDRPLAEIVRESGLPLAGGRLAGARIVVLKSERRLDLFAGAQHLKSYRIQLGGTPAGDKAKRRDSRTPEGEYAICEHRAATKYHRALMLGYPNADDAARGLARRRITRAQHDAIVAALAAGRCPPQTTRLGGLLMIHGQHPGLTKELRTAHEKGTLPLPAGHEPGDGDPSRLDRVRDWTDGCIALLNPDVRELYEFLPEGTTVEIRAGPVSGGPRP